MSIRKKHIICYYTIVEVMVAMGIFLVMMTIMMQFFTSAQKVWNAASKRNMLYADARVATNVMTREIQSMLYSNDGDDLPSSIYPFWLEWTSWTTVNNDLSGSEARTVAIKEHFTDNNDLLQDGSGDPYLTALNFISTTDLKPVDVGSDICEISYRFIPVYFTTGTPKSVNDVKGGKLERRCVSEYYYDDVSGSTKKTNPSDMPNDPYNFARNSYLCTDPGVSANRIDAIWPSVESTAPYETVIAGVYSLRFTCYFWNSASTKLDVLQSMDRAGNKPAGGAIATYNLKTGTPVPVAIRIDMKLMAPKDLKKLAIAINEDNTKQIKSLKQKMRTFSKVIYLGKREN